LTNLEERPGIPCLVGSSELGFVFFLAGLNKIKEQYTINKTKLKNGKKSRPYWPQDTFN